jgi:hypothetical protein
VKTPCQSETSVQVLERTDVAVHVEFYFGIFGPYHGADALKKDLPEKPKAKKRDADIPGLANEARCEHEQHERRTCDAEDRKERIAWVNSHAL